MDAEDAPPPGRCRGKSAPQSAARRLFASGDWHTAAEFADLCRDVVTDDDAEKCFARLVRAGGADNPDRAERIRIGRERLAQEPLQRLVQRGEMEAAGTGPARTFRTLQGDSTVFSPRPKPRKEFVALDTLTFPLELQMRDIVDARTGEALLYDEQWVRHLCEVLGFTVDAEGKATRDPSATPGELEPLECVEEIRKGKQPVRWVFRGFHRGEARRRCGENSVEVLIYPGTFHDAQFWALSENGRQPLPRKDEDKKRAFLTLLHTPHLLNRVLEAAAVPRSGGIQRALAAACSLSPSSVAKYLEQAGKKADRESRKLIDIPKPEIAPPAAPLAKAAEPIAAISDDDRDEPEEKEDAEPVVRARVNDADEGMSIAKDILVRVVKELRSVGRDVESLLSGKLGDTLRAKAKLNSVPFEVTEKQVEKQCPHEWVTERTELWPAFQQLTAVFAQVTAAVAEREAEAAQGKRGK